MKNRNTIAYCNVEFADEIYGHAIPKNRYGYCKIGATLVPLVFLDRIADHFADTTFDACSAFSACGMVGKKFWKKLLKDEQEILPDCLLQLIGEGRIVFTFPE